MPAPAFTGQIATVGTPGVALGSSQLGSIMLGGSGPYLPTVAPAVITSKALPLLCRLYSNNLVFKKSLGPLLNKPLLKWTLNSGHHPIEVDLPLNDTTANGPSQGDIVRITEQGGDGKVVYSGLIADINLNVDATPPFVALLIDPPETELAEAPIDRNYTRLTDIAQWVRDAVAATAHLTFTPQSIPDSGVYAINNFSWTNGLDVITLAKHVGGLNFWWYVDEYFMVWFQAANLTGVPAYTIAQGANYSLRKKSSPLSTLKNYVVGIGGTPHQAHKVPIAIYSNATSNDKYGTRFLTPILAFPGMKDQNTLSTVVGNIGRALDRIRSTVKITLPNFPTRFTLGRFGGPTIRYWEPTQYPLDENAPTSGGGYSPNYVILDVELVGPQQILVIGDLPAGADDFTHEIERVVSRSVQSPALMTPAQLNEAVAMDSTGQLSNTGAPSDYSTIVEADSPTLYWRMGDSTASIVDYSGNANIGTLVGTTHGNLQPGLIVGDITGCLSFSGTDAWIQGSSLALPQVPSIWLEAWVRTTASANPAILIRQSRVAPSTIQFSLELVNGIPKFTVTVAGPIAVSVSGTVTINDGGVHYVVGYYDGTNMFLLVDNVLVNQAPQSGNIAQSGITPILRVGADRAGAGLYAGAMQEAAIFLYAPASAQTLAHRNAGLGVFS